jgi:hypothetical protein
MKERESEKTRCSIASFFPFRLMINAPPLHATRPLGRALLTLGTLAASYYIVWLACSVSRYLK